MALLIKGMNFSLTQRRKGKIFKGSIWKFHTSIWLMPPAPAGIRHAGYQQRPNYNL